MLIDTNQKIFIYEQEGNLRGYILLNFQPELKLTSGHYEIDKLYIHKEFRKQSIGKSLILESFKKYGKDCWLYTWDKNESVNFYLHLGFKDKGMYEFDINGKIVKNRIFLMKGN